MTNLQHRHLKELITIPLVHLENQPQPTNPARPRPSRLLGQILDAFCSLKGVLHTKLQLHSFVLPPLHGKPSHQ